MTLPVLTLDERLPSHCTPTSQFLFRFSAAFNVCVPTTLAFISTALGVSSIIAWLFAQLPQIYKNYQLQSAAGLSIYFLAEWLLGDLTNLTGCILTKQATWQIVLATYYVTVDIALVLQYFWYTHLKKGKNILEYGRDLHDESGGSSEILDGVSLSEGSDTPNGHIAKNKTDRPKPESRPIKRPDPQEPILIVSPTYSHNEKPISKTSIRTIKRPIGSPAGFPSSQALLLISTLCVALTNASPTRTQSSDSSPASNFEFAGQIFSWCSTLLYLGSRLPQIYKNAVRHSTAGLSPTLFIAAFFGNFFYSTSLFTNPLAWGSYPSYGLDGWAGPDGSDRKEWIELAVPFWLGAAGVLFMDAIVGVQFLVYGEDMERSFVRVEDREGRSRWRRVTGWMRGWVPSPSPNSRMEETRDGEDGPLLGRRESGGGRYGAA